MQVEHCIARAKLLDIDTNKVVSVTIVRQKNHKETVELPQYLVDLILKRMNKNKRLYEEWKKENGMNSSGIGIAVYSDNTVYGIDPCSKPKRDEIMGYRYKDWKEIKFTYAEQDGVSAISLRSKLDDWSAGMGSRVACGRVYAGLDYLEGVRDHFPTLAFDNTN